MKSVSDLLNKEMVLQAIKQLGDELGRVPVRREFQQRYPSRYRTYIYKHMGGWNETIVKVYPDYKPFPKVGKEDRQRFTPEYLLETLRTFHAEHGRVPMSSDFIQHLSGLHDVGRYIRAFGSLNSAREAAGLNVIFQRNSQAADGRGYIEVTPEQYRQLKATPYHLRNPDNPTAPLPENTTQRRNRLRREADERERLDKNKNKRKKPIRTERRAA